MKTRPKVIIAVLALVAAIGIVLLVKCSPKQPASAIPSSAVQGPAGSPSALVAVGSSQSIAVGSSGPSATQKPSPELKRTFEVLNHNPIEFYGRALDQFSQPVVGADVTGSVLYNTGVKSGREVATTTTDADGYFRFNDLKGQTLGIDFKKSGYEFNPINTLFSYSYFESDHKRHIPDPKNPVIFTLWKKQGAEALVHYEKTWRFPITAGPTRINLATGNTGNEVADLVVSISRTPLQMRFGDRGFAWNASVDVLGGGLIRVGQRNYYNLAPESGYVPRFEYAQEAQSVRDAQEEKIKWTWVDGVSDDFFVSSRNGKNFARVALRIRPNVDHKEGDNEALVAAEVWLNPNGSRNLEFDPAKAIKPTP